MSQCPTCGANVSDLLPVCPVCGMDLLLVEPIRPAASEPTPSAAPSGRPPEGAAPASQDPQGGVWVQPPVPASHAATSPPGVAARLTLRRSGLPAGDSFLLGERVLIGRFDLESGPVDIDLGPLPEATYVSRHHAEVWRDGSGQWFIRDLGSRNGTFVRTSGAGQFQRVTSDCPLHDCDEVALGNARFDFQTGG